MHIHEHAHKGKWTSRPTENSSSGKKKTPKPPCVHAGAAEEGETQPECKNGSPAGSTLPPATTSLCLSHEMRWEGAGGGGTDTTGERALMRVTYLPQLQ